MGIAFAICRTAKIKSLSALKAHAGHAARTRETLNATTALTPCNQVLVGGGDPAQDALARLSILPKTSIAKRIKSTQSDINNIMNAIKIGIVTPSTKSELERLEAEKDSLEIKMMSANDDLPDIHPGIAALYRQKVDNLIHTPARSSNEVTIKRI